MTQDLAPWLLEQIAQDEWRARLACDGHWEGVHGKLAHQTSGRRSRITLSPEDIDHIVEWQPARVLTECDAKRQVIDEHGIVYRDIGFLEEDGDELVDATEEIPVCSLCVPKHSAFNRREEIPIGSCRTVRLLALPYSDRPGYREEWRPDTPG